MSLCRAPAALPSFYTPPMIFSFLGFYEFVQIFGEEP